MVDDHLKQNKIEQIANYLKSGLNTELVEHQNDFDTDDEVFRFELKGNRKWVHVSREFIDDHFANEILDKLDSLDLFKIIEHCHEKHIFITHSGISFIRQDKSINGDDRL